MKVIELSWDELLIVEALLKLARQVCMESNEGSLTDRNGNRAEWSIGKGIKLILKEG